MGKMPSPDSLKNVGLEKVKYKKLKGITTVEYGRVGQDCMFHIHIPKDSLKYWMNHKNKPLYMKLIKVIQKNNAGLKTIYAPPKESFHMLSVRIENMCTRPFFEHIMKKIAVDISKMNLSVNE